MAQEHSRYLKIFKYSLDHIKTYFNKGMQARPSSERIDFDKSKDWLH